MKWIERGLLLLGVLCIGASAAVRLEAAHYQRGMQHHLDVLLSRRAAGDTIADANRPAVEGDRDDRSALVGRIEIPRLGLDAVVAEGVDRGTLRRAVGHLPGTALPGAPGRTVLAGHRDTFFRPLEAVRAGDRLRMTTLEGRFDYEVDEVLVVEPDRVDLVAPSAAPTLTLVTCYPFHYIGPAPRRFIVNARLSATPSS